MQNREVVLSARTYKTTALTVNATTTRAMTTGRFDIALIIDGAQRGLTNTHPVMVPAFWKTPASASDEGGDSVGGFAVPLPQRVSARLRPASSPEALRLQ
ncbi:MAG: hypothetical protein QOJ67_4201 [Acidimicrobiaceae bacterium]